MENHPKLKSGDNKYTTPLKICTLYHPLEIDSGNLMTSHLTFLSHFSVGFSSRMEEY